MHLCYTDLSRTHLFSKSVFLISDYFLVTQWRDLSVELFQCILFVKVWSIWDAADGYKIIVMSWDKEKYKYQKFSYMQYNTIYIYIIYIMGVYGWERLVLTFYTLQFFLHCLLVLQLHSIIKQAELRLPRYF